MQKFLFGEMREVVWSEDRDNGGMFDWQVGVVKVAPDKFRSYVRTSWGGGAMGKTFANADEASTDIERLWDRV